MIKGEIMESHASLEGSLHSVRHLSVWYTIWLVLWVDDIMLTIHLLDSSSIEEVHTGAPLLSPINILGSKVKPWGKKT